MLEEFATAIINRIKPPVIDLDSMTRVYGGQRSFSYSPNGPESFGAIFAGSAGDTHHEYDRYFIEKSQDSGWDLVHERSGNHFQRPEFYQEGHATDLAPGVKLLREKSDALRGRGYTELDIPTIQGYETLSSVEFVLKHTKPENKPQAAEARPS